MKYLYLIGMLSLPLSMASYAVEPQQADEPNQGKGMMCCMSEEQKEQHLHSMQEHMLKMHDLSNQILAEHDPAKKEALKRQQLELMKAHHEQMMGHMKQKGHQ